MATRDVARPHPAAPPAVVVTKPSQPRRSGSGIARVLRRVAVWVLMGLVAVALLYPFLWLLSASLKPRADVFDNTVLPNPFMWSNYATVWQDLPLLTWVGNSVVVGVAAALAVTVSSALVAFGFAYFEFRGRKALFALVLGSMMLPSAVTLIPTYLIWNQLGLASTQVPLWAGNLFGSAFYIFLLRQFFRGLSREVLDAARVDGCNYFQLFWRMALPMSKPALAITFLFEFQASWADLLKPLVYLRDPALYTLPRGLKAVLDQFGQGGEREWELVLAANVVATLPMLLLFIVAGRWLMQGIKVTGNKE